MTNKPFDIEGILNDAEERVYRETRRYMPSGEDIRAEQAEALRSEVVRWLKGKQETYDSCKRNTRDIDKKYIFGGGSDAIQFLISELER